MAEEKKDLGRKAALAAKWSVLTQVASKLIGPLTTVVLARLLTPDAFGVVASATMVTSLAMMFSDAGFQKFLVQHEFADDDERSLYASVAFWTNLAISALLVLLIAVFRDPLADAVGNPGLGTVLVAASLSIPLTAMVSVQTALFQRALDFRTLFSSGVGSASLVFLVSVSLAVAGFGYWSMVVGTIASNVFLAIWLTVKSDWKPRFVYSMSALRAMFGYGAWILLEAAAAWVNIWAGTLIIGNLMNPWSVGLYKTSTSIAGSIVGLFTSALLPVVFSALSRVQDDRELFLGMFYKMQRYLAMCLVPIAFAMFVYRHMVTLVLLGDQWLETELFLGLWMLAGCIVVVFGYPCSEAYRALGKPRYCVIVQVLYLVPFLPALYLSALDGYETISVVMPAVRLLLAVINVTAAKVLLGLSPLRMIANARWYYLQAAVAVAPGVVVTSMTDSLPLALIAAACSVVIYIVMLFSVNATRVLAVDLLDKLGLSSVVPKRFRI